MFFSPVSAMSIVFGDGVNIFWGTHLGSSDLGWMMLLHYGGITLVFFIWFIYLFCLLHYMIPLRLP